MGLEKYSNTNVSAEIFMNDDKLLSRKDFVNGEKHLEVLESISKGEKILFLPNEIEDNYGSKILMVGVLKSGAKAGVLLTSVPHFFDIFPGKLLNDNITLPSILSLDSLNKMKNDKMSEFVKIINSLRNGGLSIIRYEISEQAIYVLGNKKHVCVRLLFSCKKDRDAALKICYQDPSLFVTSNYSKTTSIFTLSDKYTGIWMELSNYKIRNSSGGKFNFCATKLDFNFELDFDNFLKPTDQDVMLDPGHNLVATFDIETCEVKPEDGVVAEEDDDEETEDNENVSKDNKIINDNNKIFNIRISIADTAQSGKELLSIGMFRPCTENVIQLKSHGFNIMCRTQKELLLVFGEILKRLSPDILVTYNGNGFDIPVILLQARIEGIFDEFYCMTSPKSSDTLIGNQFAKVIHNGQTFYANKAGYTFWSNIHTTESVSGIKPGSKYKVQKSLKKFKIENGRNEIFHYWKPFGCINIDLLMISKQNYKKATSFKLSDMLKRKGIPEAKHDLSYQEIWKRWRESYLYFMNPTEKQLNELTEIDVYCAQDCFCTYLLLCSYKLLEQKRAMCKYTSLPMDVNIYNADGVKVINGIMRLCAQKNFRFIETFIHAKQLPMNNGHLKYHKEPKDAHNQGAIVNVFMTGKIHIVHPVYGEICMPVDAIDAASLYPNTMIRCGLSPENIKYEKPDDIENYVEFYLDELDDNIGRDFGIKNKTVWIFNHENKSEKYGIIPTYLNQLFIDRKRVKVEAAKYREKAEKIREHFEESHPKEEFLKDKQYSSIIEGSKLYNKYVEKHVDNKYHEYNQLADTLDAEQLTIKIKMNTVYGCMKYPKNSLFCYVIAHITTWFGRRVITHANEIVKDLGGVPCYNDTDSVYFHHDPAKFEDIFEKGITHEKFNKRMVHRSMKLSYGRAKLIEWYTNKYFSIHKDEKRKYLKYDELVKLTVNERFHQKVLNIPEKGFNDIFNERMEIFAGGPQINFLREETLFPHVIAMKKKYFGLKHETSFNKDVIERNMLVKGISSVARNVTGFAKKFMIESMLEVLGTHEIDIEKIVFDRMKKMYLTDYDLDQYSKCFTYRENVNNITVQNFVRRMKLLNHIDSVYHVPEPLEILRLVLVKQTNYLNLSGSNKSQPKSDLFEYADVIRKQNLVVDKECLLKSLYSFCSQLLTYKRFDYYSDDIDIKTYKTMILKKYIEPYFKEYINSQPHIVSLNNKIDYTRFVLKTVFNKIIACLHFKYPEVSDLLYAIIKCTNYDRLFTKINKKCSKDFKSMLNDIDFMVLSKTNKFISLNITEIMNIRENLLPKYKTFVNTIYNKIEKMFIDSILESRNTEVFPNIMEFEVLTQQELDVLKELRHILLLYITCYRYHVRIVSNCM